LGAPSAWSQALPDYLLQPGDQIEVSVWGEEELQRTVLVRPDGRFSFPLVGEVNAAGRTTVDIQAEMTEKLLTYIPEAVVTASVTGIEGNRIYVIGQVNAPGSFVMNPQLSVMQALSLARGATPFAALDNILIIRGRGSDQRVFPFAYSDISRGRNLAQNIQLESGDVVIVP
jgi:polysaccharide export outer membrane protein